MLIPTGSTERALLGVATAFAAVGVAHVVPFLIEGGAWDGAVSWRKPILFGVSFGIVTWWLAWVLGTLSWSQRAKAVWATVYTVAAVVEVGVITLQRWRGVPSHFNGTTPLDGALFSVMGAAIGVVSVLIAVLIGVALLRRPGDPATRWAVLGGLMLMLGGLTLGGLLVQLGVGQAVDGVAPETVRAGAAGVPKYAHAVALHVPQALVGLLALVGVAGLSADARRTTLRRAVFAFAALVMAASAHTMAGRALFDVANPTGRVMLAALGACAWPVVGAMMAAWRTDDSAPPPPNPDASRRTDEALAPQR
ncbi:MAG TPA: hypothetical protein VK891_00450 [Euzebyales bacterium]|nr:hypothetical protein [Euzebyales bacterium]